MIMKVLHGIDKMDDLIYKTEIQTISERKKELEDYIKVEINKMEEEFGVLSSYIELDRTNDSEIIWIELEERGPVSKVKIDMRITNTKVT